MRRWSVTRSERRTVDILFLSSLERSPWRGITDTRNLVEPLTAGSFRPHAAMKLMELIICLRRPGRRELA